MSENLLKSKTIWAGILLIAVGLFNGVTGNGFDPMPILTGLGFVGLRQALE